MHNQECLRWRAADTLLVIAVLLSALLLLLGLLLLPAHENTVQVTVDGKVVATLPLSTDAILVIDGVGGQNTLDIRDGKVTVSAAGCPDEVCVQHQPISRAGQSILCLPHKVVITILGGDSLVDGEV